MSRLRPIRRPVVLLMLTGVLAISCAAPSVYIPAGSRVAAPTVGARQQDSHIEVEVEHLIVPNAPDHGSRTHHGMRLSSASGMRPPRPSP